MAFAYQKQFLCHDPYLTFCSERRGCFVNSRGESLGEFDSAGAALHKVGRQAFEHLPKDPTREQFDSLYQGYIAMIELWRQALKDRAERTRYLDWNGLAVSPDFDSLEDEQIISIASQHLSAPTPGEPQDFRDEINAVHVQVLSIYALVEIENALLSVKLGGDGVAAAIYSADALSRVLAIESGDRNLAELRRQMAYNGAMEKLKNDPKQKEKAFVKECWIDWQNSPGRYSGKADFAQDMLKKCETLKSQPAIERWCRTWEGEKPN